MRIPAAVRADRDLALGEPVHCEVKIDPSIAFRTMALPWFDPQGSLRTRDKESGGAMTPETALDFPGAS